MKVFQLAPILFLHAGLLAQTTVTLTPVASPAAAQPNITTISVTGSGFPSGTILPQNVLVTLTAAQPGPAPAVFAPSAVQSLFGNTERVTFTIPAGTFAVSSPTSCQVSIAGTTTDLTAFNSGNTAALTVNPPPAISLTPNTGNLGQSETVTITGLYTNFLQGSTMASFGPYVSVGGAPYGQPGPVTVSTATSAVAQIAISPTAVPGSQSVQVATGVQLASSNAFTINPSSLTISSTSPLPTGTIGIGYSTTLTASGGSGTYTWSIAAGALPAGLTLAAATGMISGQPTTAGPSNFTVQVTDTNQITATKPFALTIDSSLTITTTSPLPTGTVGVGYSTTLMAAGGSGTYIWSITAGTLPTGLTLFPATGVISGQPTSAGPSNFTVQVTDTNQVTATKPFALTIDSSLTITTASPLPTGTVGVAYSTTLMAAGGSGTYTWSLTTGTLPAGLTLAAATGLVSGQPTTAGPSSFTIQVTDTNQVTATKPFALTIDSSLTITTTSPLPNGTVGVAYSTTLMAAGGSGTYTWSLTTGTLPAGLTLAPATGAVSGQPTTAVTSNFTIQVNDTNNVTAIKPFALTINPGPMILSVVPNSANAGLSLQVTITAINTNFVQGTTEATFGPGISVGDAAAGAFGPVTVNSPTVATANISIAASAATGSQTVTVTTGAEQAVLPNGFTILPAIPSITITTTSTTPLAPGFSGFDDEYLLNGVEYWDPKFLAMVTPMRPGWIRFPGGTPSMAFDWETAHMNTTWMATVEPFVNSDDIKALVTAQEMTQAKGGACFVAATCVSDYATFLTTLGAKGIVALNGFTDNNPNSDGDMATAAQGAGINILEWELDNEPYDFPEIFPTATDYAAYVYNPYYLHLHGTDPSATAGVFFQGQFLNFFGNYQLWDSTMQAYSPQYWQGVSFHVYPISNQSMPLTDEEQTLNGILAHGTTEYYSSYVQPLVGENTPVFFSELNSGPSTPPLPFESYIYNGIFVAEWVTRMSAVPQVQAVGVSALFFPNYFSEGMICAVDDFELYLEGEVLNNPNYSTDTSTNPNTQYSFYYSTTGLAMAVVNQAINNSTATLSTVLSGGPTVPILGYDGNPIPAIFAQGYQGSNGTQYLVVTNKSASSVPVAIEVDGNLLQSAVTVSYISNPSDTAQNNATAQTTVQIVTGASANPVTIGPYSVTRIEWPSPNSNSRRIVYSPYESPSVPIH